MISCKQTTILTTGDGFTEALEHSRPSTSDFESSFSINRAVNRGTCLTVPAPCIIIIRLQDMVPDRSLAGVCRFSNTQNMKRIESFFQIAWHYLCSPCRGHRIQMRFTPAGSGVYTWIKVHLLVRDYKVGYTKLLLEISWRYR